MKAAATLLRQAQNLAPGYDVKITFENGLIRLTETTPYGGITVNMPGDVPLREKFSGSIFLDPAGKTDAERREFLERLKDYDLSFDPIDPYDHVPIKVITENVGYPNSLGMFTGTIFESTPRQHTLFFEGKPVIRTELPTPAAPTPPPTSFTIPTGGQQGSFIILPGPFDGTVSDTDFTKIGGTSVPTIAESHHSRIVWNTSKSIVPTIEVGENGQTGMCPFHNVSVHLSHNAPIHLLKGQHADVTVTFSGLGQLNQDVQYLLVNHSPAVVHMAGGTESETKIIPQIKVVDVNGAQGGTFTDKVSITGAAPGTFVITATVLWKETCNLPPNAKHKQ